MSAPTTGVASQLLGSRKAKRTEAKRKKAAALLQLLNEGGGKRKMTVESDEALPRKLKKVKEKTSHETEPESKELIQRNYFELKKEIDGFKKMKTQGPQLYLSLDEMNHQYSHSAGNLVMKQESALLFMLDLQQLLLYALQGSLAGFKPRWCQLVRWNKVSSVLVIVLQSVSTVEYSKYSESFPNLNSAFKMRVEMVSPYHYGNTVEDDLFKVPISLLQLWKMGLTKSKIKLLMHKHSQSAKSASSNYKDIIGNAADSFPRTHLLLNPVQMVYEGFPLPVSTKAIYENFIFSKDSYSKVTNESPLFAIDCEMCITSNQESELTRISVVNEKLETIYDTLVKPHNEIIDYATRWSGITKEMLDPVQKQLCDVQRDLQALLPSDAILCGQSLSRDLMAIKMFHPYVIDTSIIYNLSGHRMKKSGLKKLSEFFLGKRIQDSLDGHCSVEDAITTMELVCLKLKQGLDFGDVILNKSLGEITDGPDPLKDNREPNDSCVNKKQRTQVKLDCFPVDDNKNLFFNRTDQSLYQSFFEVLKENKKEGLLVDKSEIAMKYQKQPVEKIEAESDREREKMAELKLFEKDFLWLQFHAFDELIKKSIELDEDEVKACLRKLDRRVCKLVNKMFSNSLVAVVLAGRADDQICSNAMTFIKIC